MESCGVDQLHGVDHEVGEVVFIQPFVHARQKKEPLLAISGLVAVCYTKILGGQVDPGTLSSVDETDEHGPQYRNGAGVTRSVRGWTHERIGMRPAASVCSQREPLDSLYGGGIASEAWERFLEHDGTKLQQFPLPVGIDGQTATLLDRLAQELAGVTPAAVVAAGVPTAAALKTAEARYREVRGQMIAAQERLDWEAYRWYGLVDEDLTTGEEPEPPLALGERAFEIVLAQQVAAEEAETSWFTRHGSTPITELPARWPEGYRRLVERRIELIGADPEIALVERPEYKRRWATRPWDDQVRDALRNWLGCGSAGVTSHQAALGIAPLT